MLLFCICFPAKNLFIYFFGKSLNMTFVDVTLTKPFIYSLITTNITKMVAKNGALSREGAKDPMEKMPCYMEIKPINSRVAWHFCPKSHLGFCWRVPHFASGTLCKILGILAF
jgi:hypothetical protein